MRAVVLSRHGGPEVLQISEVPEPALGKGKVAVRVRTVGINYAEVQSRRGLYGWAPRKPYVLGMEACGEIAALGPEVTGRRVGERVVVGAQYGCYADMAVVREAQALPAIESFSDEENAAFPVNYLTAWIALVEMARLRATDRVLITAAAGGVGTAAVQLARAWGCTVVGAAGSPSKLPRLRELGVHHAVSYEKGELAREVRACVPAVDVALEVVGGEVYRQSLELLAPFGRVVVAGFASLDLQRWNPLSWWRTYRDMPKASVRALAVASRGVSATHIGYLLADAGRMRSVWSALCEFVQKHGIRPVIGERFRLEEIAAAHRLMESRKSVGKLVVRLE